MRTISAFAIASLVVACAGTASVDPLALDEEQFRREIEQRFQYGPPQPPPAQLDDARAGRVADAAYLVQFPNYDRAYNDAARAHALRLARRLEAEADHLSHEQFVLRVAEIAALADNGHTAIGENAFRKNTPRLPLRTYLFADGLYVVWAAPGLTDLLGARIHTIDGHSVEEIYGVIRRYSGGVEARRRRILIPMLESPALLQAAGLAETRDSLMLAGVLADGQPFSRRIAAEERDRSAWVSSTARLLYPAPAERMVGLMRDDDPLPVYLRNGRNLFSTEVLPHEGFYIGLTHNADGDDAPIATFLDGALAQVRHDRPAYVVLDMRMNGGGDYTTTYNFARALPRAAAGSAIYVFTSPWTFSAAITTVAAVKDAGGNQVVLVGEPVGDRLDFWAEGARFQLPNTFLQVQYAAGRHVYDGPCEDLESCFWLNYRYPVRVRSLAPDIEAPLTFAAYREFRDPALEAVLAREASRRGADAHTR